MVRTRVGYAGGITPDPTYRDLGDHTETVQLDYDPTGVSYEELLNAFWASHTPVSPAWDRQYASIVFVHDEEQMLLAMESKARQEKECECTLHTDIIPSTEFYLAEDYHQKYQLRKSRAFLTEFAAMYPDPADFVNSTAAARVNGYLSGYGTLDDLQAEINDLGLSSETREALLTTVRRRQG